MQLVLSVLSVVLLLTGLVLRFVARRHRTPAAQSMSSFNPVHWFTPWRLPDYLTPLGMKYHVSSVACIVIGVALYIFVTGMPSLFE